MIPLNYSDWKKCIIQDCKIDLTKEFALERLNVYQDNRNPETLKFISLYGVEHLRNIIQWYTQVLEE